MSPDSEGRGGTGRSRVRGWRTWSVLLAVVLGAEAVVCALIGEPGERLRLWVNTLSVQGIVLALVGTFLLVDRPFAAARAVRGGGRNTEVSSSEGRHERRDGRRRSGWALLLLGSLLFGGAALIWSVGSGG